MTTAHRPTWAPAKGGEEQGGARWFVPSVQRSAKTQAGQLTLKFRKDGQNTVSDVEKRDLLVELEGKERKYYSDKQGGLNFEEERKKDLLLLEAMTADVDRGGKGAPKHLQPRAADADEEDPDDADESSSSDDDDDDEEDLMAELERIKKERAEDAAKKAKVEKAEADKHKEAELRTGNPLLPIAATENAFSIKRRWDDDVVFKNQARGEPKATKRFINDTIRSDFHKKFLNRYVR